MIHSENSKKNKNHFVGCLLGGAIGDAFGWPIEFMKLDSIKNKYGENGLAKLFIGSNGKAEITDDTQMTMFTAEGLLRANNRLNSKGICHAPTVIYFAYLRWLYTQGYPKKENYDFIYDGWLIEIKELFFRRAPGNSCISSLLSDKKGNINFKINDSKGCGAIMRSAPFGLFLRSEEALEISRESAALTHGHPTGQIAAGGLSYLIAEIIKGYELNNAVDNTIKRLKFENDSFECIDKLEDAVRLSKSNLSDIEAINELGQGWIGEEALGIAVFCALRYSDNFEKAIITSVNHDGDSDSTGSITGNILGAYLGVNEIPSKWIESIELSEKIAEIATDLLNDDDESQEWWNKYPGY